MKKLVRSLIPHEDGQSFWVPLTRGKFARIDKEDAERIGEFNWCAARKGTRQSPLWYARGRPNWRRTIELHRFITDCPQGLVVDHLNFDTLDNRRANLHVCTAFDNNSRTRTRCQEEHFRRLYHPIILRAEPQPTFAEPLPPPRYVPNTAAMARRVAFNQKILARLDSAIARQSSQTP